MPTTICEPLKNVTEIGDGDLNELFRQFLPKNNDHRFINLFRECVSTFQRSMSTQNLQIYKSVIIVLREKLSKEFIQVHITRLSNIVEKFTK